MLIIVCLGLCLLVLLAPRVANRVGKTKLEQFGITSGSFTVTELGPGHVRATDIWQGNEDDPWLRCGVVEARFRPSALPGKNIDQLRLHDLVIDLGQTNGWQELREQVQPGSAPGSDGDREEPWRIGRLKVSRSAITVPRDGDLLRFPFAVEASDLRLGPPWSGQAVVTSRLGSRRIRAAAHVASSGNASVLQFASAGASDALLVQDFWPGAPLNLASFDWDASLTSQVGSALSGHVNSTLNLVERPDHPATVDATFTYATNLSDVSVHATLPTFSNGPWQVFQATAASRERWPAAEGQENLTCTIDIAGIRRGEFSAGTTHVRFDGTADLLQLTGSTVVNGWNLAQPVSATGTIRNIRQDRRALTVTATTSFAPDSRIEIPARSSTVGPVVLEGDLQAELAQAPSDATRWLDLQTASMNLDLPQRQLSLQGLATACRWNLDRFPQSQASQQATADKLQFGAIVLSNLVCRYQVQDDKGIFLEQVQATWCGGRVDLHALHLSPDQTEHDVLLHCSQLEIRDVLQQFGISLAQLDGRINGRIPVRRQDGQLRFDHGFLHTTPGQTGTLAVRNSDLLGQVLAGNPNQARISLALAALKNFEYDWITLTLASKGTALQLAMKVFGKPGQPIPYALNEKTGAYEEVRGRDQSGIRPPMQFDLNFSVPLDDILRYTMKTKELVE